MVVFSSTGASSALVLMPPFLEGNLHSNEVMAVRGDLGYGFKTRFSEGLLSAEIPFQCVEVHAVQIELSEGTMEQRADGIGAKALAPVVFISYHDSQLSLAAVLVNVIQHGVADVLAP
jgi:hypothetical protein